MPLPEPYTMPPAALGPCLWRHSHADTEAVPALITQIGTRSVLLTVFAPDNRGGMPRDGVRHASDPELREMPANDSGCWDYLPVNEANTALLYDALDRIAALEASFAELKTAVGA